MADLNPETSWDFAETIQQLFPRPNTKRPATVQSVDTDGTIWVSLPGSSHVTPIKSTGANVSPGDTVLTELRGTSLHITVNQSDPAIGESRATNITRRIVRPVETEAKIAKTIADEAQAVADATAQHFFADDNGAHITDVTQDEWTAAVNDNFSDYDPDTKPYHNQLLNSLGILLRTALNNLVSITRSAIAFYDGTGNAASNIVARFGSDGAQIGKTGAAHSVIDAYGQRFYGGSDGTTQLANIGYGEGETQSGTAIAPYFTMGLRKKTTSVYVPSTTYNVGDHVLYEGVEYVCARTHTLDEWTPSKWSLAIGAYSNASGTQVTACGYASHAEGSGASAVAAHDHAEGVGTIAHGGSSHAEGWRTEAAGNASHAEGDYTYAGSFSSHAEGNHTRAYSSYSHAQNKGTIARSEAQTAIGKYNVEDANDTYALIIGNGTDNSNRSNALTVDWSGNVEAAGSITGPIDSTDTASDIIDANTSGGWSIVSASAKRWGKICALTVTASKNAAITLPVTGDIDNQFIGTLKDGYRPADYAPGMCWTYPGFAVAYTNGEFRWLTATPRSSAGTVAANSNVIFRIHYMLS